MDKFNRHIHSNVNNVLESVSTFYFETTFFVLGLHTDRDGNFLLLKDNWNWAKKNMPPTNRVYEVPLNLAVIKEAKWYPAESVVVYVNDVKYETFPPLTGVTLKKGDKIRAVHKPHKLIPFQFEAVVAIPVSSSI